MTATLEAVREAMAEDISAIPGLRVDPYLRDQANPPCAMLDVEGPTQVTFSTAGAVTYTFTLLYIDQRVSEVHAQKRCDELRDPFHARSLKRALEDGTHLAALTGVDYSLSTTPGLLIPVTIGATPYLACEFPIEVVIHEET